MPHEPHGPAPRDNRNPEDLWNGLPLRLEGHEAPSRIPAVSAGEETVDRPIADLLPPAVPPPPTRGGVWLSVWLTLTGVVAGLLAFASIVLAFLTAEAAGGWKGPLVAFDCAVIIFVVRSFVVAGMAPAVVCHHVFSVAGLGAASLAIFGSVLSASAGFIYGSPPPELLTNLFVFGALGLAGCMIFAQCLQGRSWACRAAAVSSLVFVILLVLQPFTEYALLTNRPALFPAHLERCWLLSLVVCFGAAGHLHLRRLARRSGRRGTVLAAAYLWLAAAAVALALVVGQLIARYGAAEASAGLWKVSVVWSGAAFAPLLLAGLAQAWRRHGSLRGDLYAATGFACSLTALGGLVALALWLPLHWHAGQLEILLVAAGAVAMIAGVWLIESGDYWATRWGLLPAVALAVAAAAALGPLLVFVRDMDAAREDLWRLGAVFLWCSLVVAFAFAAGGLAVRWHRGRAFDPEEALQDDIQLICTAGSMFSGLLLCVALALLAGNAEVVRALRALLAQTGASAEDLLTLSAGAPAARWLARAFAAVRPVLAGRGFELAGAGALAAVLAAHLLTAARAQPPLTNASRRFLVGLSALWFAALSVASVLVLLSASHLLLPPREPSLTTPVGWYLGGHLTVRLLLFALLAGLLARFWEALAAVVRAARSGRRARPRYEANASRPAGRAAAGPRHGRHLGFFIYAGILLSGAGLGLALLLHLGPGWEATLLELSRLAVASATAGADLLLRIGRLCAQEPSYAAAAALIAFFLIGLHEEARRGRAQILPLVGAVWLLFLIPFGKAWALLVSAPAHPSAPGRTAALAIAGALLAALLVGAAALLAGWRTHLSRPSPAGLHVAAGAKAWTARSLGSLGVLGCLIGSAIVIHGALGGNPLYDRSFAWAVERAGILANNAAAAVDSLKAALEKRGDLGVGIVALVAVSSAALFLHFLAGFRVPWALYAAYGLWFAAALCGGAAIAYMVHHWPLGTWTPAQLFWGLVLTAVVARVAAALANPRSWLGAR